MFAIVAIALLFLVFHFALKAKRLAIALSKSQTSNLNSTIRAIFATSNDAIALTAYAREKDEQRSLEAGFQVHLTKPLDAEELIAAIARLGQLDH